MSHLISRSSGHSVSPGTIQVSQALSHLMSGHSKPVGHNVSPGVSTFWVSWAHNVSPGVSTFRVSWAHNVSPGVSTFRVSWAHNVSPGVSTFRVSWAHNVSPGVSTFRVSWAHNVSPRVSTFRVSWAHNVSPGVSTFRVSWAHNVSPRVSTFRVSWAHNVSPGVSTFRVSWAHNVSPRVSTFRVSWAHNVSPGVSTFRVSWAHNVSPGVSTFWVSWAYNVSPGVWAFGASGTLGAGGAEPQRVEPTPAGNGRDAVEEAHVTRGAGCAVVPSRQAVVPRPACGQRVLRRVAVATRRAGYAVGNTLKQSSGTSLQFTVLILSGNPRSCRMNQAQTMLQGALCCSVMSCWHKLNSLCISNSRTQSSERLPQCYLCYTHTIHSTFQLP